MFLRNTVTAAVSAVLIVGLAVWAPSVATADRATPEPRAPKDWSLTFADGSTYIAFMRGTQVSSKKAILPSTAEVVAVGSHLVVSDRGDDFLVAPLLEANRGMPVDDLEGERVGFIPHRAGVYVTETIPNGETLFVSFQSYPGARRTFLYEYPLGDPSKYLWIEDGTSAPVGARYGYLGAHQYETVAGKSVRKEFVLLEMAMTGEVREKYRFNVADYGNYVTNFCVSKAGRKLAVTYYPSRGFRENLAIIDMQTRQVRTLDGGDHAITGQCWINETDLIASANDRPYLISTKGSIRYTKLGIPGDGYEMFVR